MQKNSLHKQTISMFCTFRQWTGQPDRMKHLKSELKMLQVYKHEWKAEDFLVIKNLYIPTRFNVQE